MGQRDFDEFARASIPALVRFGRALTADLGRAEDLAQVALLRTHERWARLGDAGQEPLSYAKKVMVNQEISWRRLLSSRERPGDVPPETRYAGAADGVADGVAARHDLLALVRALPPRQRAVVVLRYYDDAADRDIADALGCTESTVRSLAAKALAALRITGAPVPQSVEESA